MVYFSGPENHILPYFGISLISHQEVKNIFLFAQGLGKVYPCNVKEGNGGRLVR